MTASKMKKCPKTTSLTTNSLRLTNHEQNTSPSPLSLCLKYYCGETSSSYSSTRKASNYLSSTNELNMIDKSSSDKQLNSSFQSTYNLEDWESKLNPTCCHRLEPNKKETNTIASHSFPSNQQSRNIINKVLMDHILSILAR